MLSVLWQRLRYQTTSSEFLVLPLVMKVICQLVVQQPFMRFYTASTTAQHIRQPTGITNQTTLKKLSGKPSNGSVSSESNILLAWESFLRGVGARCEWCLLFHCGNIIANLATFSRSIRMGRWVVLIGRVINTVRSFIGNCHNMQGLLFHLFTF